MDEAFVKAFPIDRDIIHVNFRNAFYQITENAEHTSLERGKGITQAEGHSPIGICAKGASEGCLVLIICSNFNLEVAQITIQKAVEGVT